MEATDSKPATRLEKWGTWALLVLLPLAVYWNTLHSTYHLDDIYRIANNGEIDRWWPPWRHFADPFTSATLPNLVQFRPMLPLTLSGNVAFAERVGLDRLVGLHLGNIAIHIVGVVLLYSLFRELILHWSGTPRGGRESGRLALVGALIFGVHPVSGVSVNYLCGRDMLLMLMFFLAALLTYVRLRRLGGSVLRWSLFCLLLTAALLSKANAMAMPLVLVAFEVTCGGGTLFTRWTYLRSVPALLVILAVQAYSTLVLHFSDVGQVLISRDSVSEYPLTQLSAHFSHYGKNLLWPFQMRAEADFPLAKSLLEPSVLAGLLCLGGSLYLAWRWRNSRPLLAFGVGAYWVLFSMTSSLLPMRRLVTDYRQVPSLALGVLVVPLLGHAWLRGRSRVVASVLLLLWLGGSSSYMNRHWETEESFWLQSVTHGGSALAHMNYGLAVKQKDPELAEKHFQKTLELYPGHIYGNINLGLLRIEQGADEEGLKLVRYAVAIDPSWALSHYWLSIALGKLTRWTEAAVEVERALELDPRNETYRARRLRVFYADAFMAQKRGEFERALSRVQQLHGFTDSYLDSRFLEAFALQKLGRVEDSVPVYQAFLEGNPNHAQAWFNVGCAYQSLRAYGEARRAFSRTLELRPDDRDAASRMADCQ